MASLPPGTLLGTGRYRVLKEVNRGGTAVVYECETIPSGEHVALKVMTVKDGRASMPIKGVKREIEYTASVQHANVVKLLDFFAEAEHVVIVWELIQGPDLLDLLNECGGRLAEPDAAFYFSQLLHGVLFIHERGLCHRDLKPENVMIDRRTRTVKIIDFGLSKHQASAVTLGVGTPDYMAPELLGNGSVQTLYERRTGRYDARASDIWALGVLLYLLVTGQYPFEDPLHPQNVVATLQNIMGGRMRPLPRRVSSSCADLIRAMLTLQPEKRLTLQEISNHPWVTSLGGSRAVPAPAPSTPPAGQRPPSTYSADQEESALNPTKATQRRVSFAFTATTGPAVVQRHTPALGSSSAHACAAAPGEGPVTLDPVIEAPTEVSAPRKSSLRRPADATNAAPSEKEVQAVRTADTAPAPFCRSGLGGFCRLWFGSRQDDG